MRTRRPLLIGWEPGPDQAVGEVLVSVTQFTAAHVWSIPSVYWTGFRLRQGWYAMQGAVGLWLWAIPPERRSGSISVWASAEDLRRFVTRPRHVDVMRRFRPLGQIDSTSWSAEQFVPERVLRRARAWIADPAALATAAETLGRKADDDSR